MEPKILEEIMQESAPGPRPAFGTIHLLRAILLIGKEAPIGRKNLSVKLSLGAGSVRTLIQRLKNNKLICERKHGCDLTETGSKLCLILMSRISETMVIEAGRLSLGRWNVAILVRGVAGKISAGLEQRDAAIKIGATGANTIIYSSGKFIVPRGCTDCAAEYPDNTWDRLRTNLSPNDGDVIIVSGGPSHAIAENGALAAAWTFITDQMPDFI